MDDAKPMSKDQLRHRLLQGRKLHQEATSGSEHWYYPEDMLRVWERASTRVELWQDGFLRRRQAQ